MIEQNLICENNKTSKISKKQRATLPLQVVKGQ